jgi:putative pyruvate formate lyase activating enzyme
MPGLTGDSIAALDWIKANIPTALVNLMEQYRPAYRAVKYAEINRRLTAAEYRPTVDYFSKLGLRDGSEYQGGWR